MDPVLKALKSCVPRESVATSRLSQRIWLFCLMLAVLALSPFAGETARATPAVTIDAYSGAVLYEEDAALPWYPASLTKMMTAYVALKAVGEGKITLATPLAVSSRATAMPPSKMGFRPGTLITLDNALKILMVKSANDVAVTIAEGVSGSVEAFAEDMNQTAIGLGLRQSHFVNPNGLPHPQHVSSARDMAILARALYAHFPQYAGLFSIGALRLGDNVMRNHNNMLGRYPGADGIKTGFTCAAGFNIAASATQGGRKIIAVVLGAPNVETRTVKTAALFDRAFAGIDRPTRSVVSLESPSAPPPDMRSSVCMKRGKTVAAFNAEIEQLIAPLTNRPEAALAKPDPSGLYASAALDQAVPMALRIGMVPPPAFDPLPVQIGVSESYTGPIAQVRPPHSPVGTQMPATARAYTENPETSFTLGNIPIPPDSSALPMRGRGKPTPAAKTKKKRTVKAPASASPPKRPATTRAAPAQTTAPASKTSSVPKPRPVPRAEPSTGKPRAEVSLKPVPAPPRP
jgi:D-alanyl-D-alanine carboxypeptidase